MHVWVLFEDLFGLLGYLVALGLCDVKFAHSALFFIDHALYVIVPLTSKIGPVLPPEIGLVPSVVTVSIIDTSS